MSRRHIHLQSAQNRDPRPYETGPQPLAYCRPGGAEYNDSFSPTIEHVDCKACRSKYFSNLLKEHNDKEDVAKLELVSAEGDWGEARSGSYYRILRDGVHIGYVTFDKREWVIANLVHNEGRGQCGNGQVRRGYYLEPDAKEWVDSKGRTHVGHTEPYAYKTKEEALLATEAFFESGKLSTAAQVLAAHADYKARSAAYELACAESRREVLTKLDATFEGLHSIRRHNSLSNEEIAALEHALALVSHRVKEVQESA